jgi:hypothetical protein
MNDSVAALGCIGSFQTLIPALRWTDLISTRTLSRQVRRLCVSECVTSSASPLRHSNVTRGRADRRAALLWSRFDICQKVSPSRKFPAIFPAWLFNAWILPTEIGLVFVLLADNPNNSFEWLIGGVFTSHVCVLHKLGCWVMFWNLLGNLALRYHRCAEISCTWCLSWPTLNCCNQINIFNLGVFLQICCEFGNISLRI